MDRTAQPTEEKELGRSPSIHPPCMYAGSAWRQIPRMRPKSILLTLLLFLVIQPLQAASARRGWTKLELSPADGKGAPAPAALLERFGAELIADYGAYAVVSVPKGIVTALEAQ